MAVPTTRQEFKDWCLRKIGAPVIQINLSDEQIDDAIDEAIYFWNDFHYDGAEHVYLKHQLTQTDIDNGYITVPPELTGVTRMFNVFSSISAGTGMFNITYQFVLNNAADLSSYSINEYWMTMQNIRFLQEWLVGLPMIRFNRHNNIVHIDVSSERLAPGNWLVLECYAPIDESNTDMWSDRWLQNYATVLIRERWGQVLSKFVGVQLMGGMQFNGEMILANAREDRQRMEEDAINRLQPILMNYMG